MALDHETCDLTNGALQLVYVTTANRENALELAKVVVMEKLAACANIMDGMTSVYQWEGALHEESEAVLILKTRRALVPRLTERIKALHRYDCPCVVSFDIADGNVDFLKWIESNTQ